VAEGGAASGGSATAGGDVAAGEKVYVLDHNRDSLRQWFQQRDLPPYRADQVLKWVYRKVVADIEKMTDLPKDLREALRRKLVVFRSDVAKESRAADGVIKLLLEFPDGSETDKETGRQGEGENGRRGDAETRRRGDQETGRHGDRDTGRQGEGETRVGPTMPDPRPPTPPQVACVMIPQADRRTACLSTQAGCAMGCVFCASGMYGLERNLTSGEIVEQLLRLQVAVGPDKRMTHVVIMGMGEPLANFDATVEAIYTINERWGFGLGARHITVSTVGIPERIRQLADHNLQINLAISLHAPTDALRRRLVPAASRVTINQIFDAARYYFDITGREITLEYVLLAGVNDHMTQANQLAKLARTLRCSVNLIPFNPVEGLEYQRPGVEQVYAFQEVLRKAGVRTKVRKSRGVQADAACGQLRRRARQQTLDVRAGTGESLNWKTRRAGGMVTES
jgi:23S rRNA (adenine2503-C2)-methyltransferase